MEKVIFYRRITVFVKNMVMCTNEVRKKLSQEFPLAHVAPNTPFVAPQPIMACPPIADGTPWMMDLFLDGTRVFFNPSQIDIISQAPSTDVKVEKEKTKNTLFHIGKIVNVLEITEFTRIAYVPICGIEGLEGKTIAEYFNSHLSFNLPDTASNAKDRNVSFSFTYGLKSDPFKDNDINIACKLTEGTKSNGQVSTPTLIVETDINTKAELSRNYSLVELTTFVEESIDLNAKVMDSLLS